MRTYTTVYILLCTYIILDVYSYTSIKYTHYIYTLYIIYAHRYTRVSEFHYRGNLNLHSFTFYSYVSYIMMRWKKKNSFPPSLINRQLREVEDQWHIYMYEEQPRAAGHFHSHYYWFDQYHIIIMTMATTIICEIKHENCLSLLKISFAPIPYL